jgi:hypothetical protein
MSPAYVRESEPGVYAMYRDIMVEDDEGNREKFGKSIGPMYLLRIAKSGESVDFLTSLSDGTVLQLHRFYPPQGEIK